jgi:hypothetical protein
MQSQAAIVPKAGYDIRELCPYEGLKIVFA